MSLRKVLTSERSAERWIVGALGVGFLVYAAVQASRSQYGVAAFLAISGAIAVVAAWLCSDKFLRVLGTAAIGVNILVAVIALFGSA